MSAEVSIIIGTYNRVSSLRNAIESIHRECKLPYTIHVTDAGSTDGTVEFLQSLNHPRVVAHLVGKKIGQAQSLNLVLQGVSTPYTCWLSDDNVIVNGSIDLAVGILEKEPLIGMVALKTKDMIGQFKGQAYIGGITPFGILNVNQGVIRTKILKKVNGFCEILKDYGIDPDLTTKVLIDGHRVVYTRRVGVHHYREWVNASPEVIERIQDKQKKSMELYGNRYQFLQPVPAYAQKKSRVWSKINKVIAAFPKPIKKRFRRTGFHRDWMNSFNSRCILWNDPFITRLQEHYLVQYPEMLYPQEASQGESASMKQASQ